MDLWIRLLMVIFILCILLFTGVAIYVGLGGLKDIKALFHKMNTSPKANTGHSDNSLKSKP